MILAVDQSTPTCSAALLHNGAILAQRQWAEGPARNQQLFPELQALLQEAAVTPSSINLFALGLGPGSFSGLRIAICALQGMALPLGKPVVGIASGEAIAFQVMQTNHTSQVHVLGDARRGHLWTLSCSRLDNRPTITSPCRLIHPDSIPELLSQPGTIASPEYDRIASLLTRHDPTATRHVPRSVIPSAATLAQIVAATPRDNIQPGALIAPIYMHPPVLHTKQP